MRLISLRFNPHKLLLQRPEDNVNTRDLCETVQRLLNKLACACCVSLSYKRRNTLAQISNIMSIGMRTEECNEITEPSQ